MAGGFSKSVRPKLPGSFFNWEADVALTVPPSVGGIVAIPLTHDWGPLNEPTLCDTFDEFTAIFGKSDTQGRRAVFGAFKGEGTPGKGGAGAVLVYRMGTGAAAAATITLQNTTPANALTLTARYPGTRANALHATVQAGAIAGTKDLIILDGATPIATYTHEQTGLADLAAEINASDDFLEATLVNDGVALANVANQALAGGNDGAVLTGAEWTAAMSALEVERFAIVAPHDLTDSTIRTSLTTWIKTLNDRGKRLLGVIGGAANETATTANARSRAINDWDVVNVGLGLLHDDVLNVDMSTSQFASRVAGAIANRGEKKDAIYMRFAGVSLKTGATLQELSDAVDAGTTVFSRDTNVLAPVHIRQGCTTYTTQVDEEHPVDLYKVVKNVRVQHGFELELQDYAESGDVLGDLPVNDRVRALVIGEGKSILDRRVRDEIVQPGFSVELDTDPPPSDDQDFIQVRYGLHPTRAFRQMYSTARIG